MRKKIVIGIFGLFLWSGSPAFAQSGKSDFAKHYDSGVELFRAEKFLSAQKEFEKAQASLGLGNDIHAEEIEYYLAACAAENGGADAEQRLVAFLKTYPGTIHANNVHLTLGNRYQAEKRYADALEQYRQVDPSQMAAAGRSEFYFNRGYAYFHNGNDDQAVSDFNRVGSDRVYGPSAVYYKAYIDYENNRLESARQGFLSLSNNKQYAPVIPFYILHIDFKNKDYRAVVNNGPNVLKSAVGDRKTETLRVIGESWYHLENYPEALRYLDTYANEKRNLSREEQYMIGYAAYMTGDFEKAVNYLGKVAVGEDVLAQNASFHIGSASLRMGDKQKAKQAFSLAMRIEGDRAVQEEAMFNFAKLEYELGGGMFNQSIETINRFLEEFPDSPNLDEARGYLLSAYLNNKNYAAAYDAVTKIKNPDNETRTALQKIAYYRGLEYFMDGDYENARQMFDIATANRFSAKYNALTKYWLAETYYRQGQYLRAVPLYQDYIVLSPKGERENTMAHYNLAYCYFNQKNLKDAKTWFERFDGIYDSKDAVKADTYNRLGDIDYLNRNYSDAIRQYDRAMAIGSPEADYARFQRAMALGLSAGTSQKIPALQQITASNSEYADAAMYELGSTYRKQENFSEASSTLRRFIEKYPNSPYYLNAMIDLGLISQNMGRNDEAMKYYKQVVDQYPNSSQAKDAMLGIQNIYMDSNDPQGYFAYAERAGMETNVTTIEKDSLTFHVAERVYLSGDARRSLPLMQTYLSQFPQGNYTANATYYIADSQMQLGDTDAALDGFEKVVDMKFSPFTLHALQKAAALNYEKGNYRRAADEFYRLTQLASVRGTVEKGLMGYIRSVEKLGEPDETIRASEYVLGSVFASEEVKLETQFALGQAYLAKGNADQALAAFRKASANMKTRNGSESQYHVAQLLYDAGRLDEAEKEILKFSETNTSHQYWLGKSFLLLGDIYMKRGDDFQAKATYQSIVDGYGDHSDGIVEEASRKLDAIN